MPTPWIGRRTISPAHGRISDREHVEAANEQHYELAPEFFAPTFESRRIFMLPLSNRTGNVEGGMSGVEIFLFPAR